MSHESTSETRMNGHHGEGKVPALKALTGEEKTKNMQTNSQLLIRPKNYIKKYDSDMVGIQRRLLGGSVHLVESCVMGQSCEDPGRGVSLCHYLTAGPHYLTSGFLLCLPTRSRGPQQPLPSAFSTQLQEGVF